VALSVSDEHDEDDDDEAELRQANTGEHGSSQKSVPVSESTATRRRTRRDVSYPFLTFATGGRSLSFGSAHRDGTALMPKHRRSFWTRIKMSLWRIFAPGSGGASDPLVGVRQPIRSGPSGRRSAAAVMEPDDDGAGVVAVGGGHGGSHLQLRRNRGRLIQNR